MDKNNVMEMMNNMIKKRKGETLNRYKYLNEYAKKGETLFVGSSLMEFFPINELKQLLDKEIVIYNRGIAGSVTTELLENINTCILDLEPSRIFINIGTNDIASKNGVYNKETLIKNYEMIIKKIKEDLPETKVYMMAYYPCNGKADFNMDKEIKESMFKTRTNEAVNEANIAVEELANKYNYEFINVNEGLMDEEGNLKAEYSTDGVHLWPNGYAVVLNNLKKYL